MKTKQILLAAVLLTGLAAGTMSVRADDHNMSNMPGMNMGGQAASTNAPDAKAKPYPLKTCVVSGDKLDGDMGKPVTLIYKGQEMKFCCKDCVKDFKKDPDKYMKKFDEEVKKQTDSK